MKRGEVERVKAFILRAVDHYRPSYGKRSQDFPRRCVFIGTTNSDAYLADETGNRRFWPVKTGAIDLDALRRDVRQLWAEAVAAYQAGEAWWLDAEIEPEAAKQQELRRITDPWGQPVLDWAKQQVDLVTVAGALKHALQLDVAKQDRAASTRVGIIFKANGWELRQKRVEGGSKVRFYLPPLAQPSPNPFQPVPNLSPTCPQPVPTCPAVPTSPRLSRLHPRPVLTTKGPHGCLEGRHGSHRVACDFRATLPMCARKGRTGRVCL
jgi:hypothetical protein